MKYANMKDFTFEEAKEEFKKLKKGKFDLKPIMEEMDKNRIKFNRILYEADIDDKTGGHMVLARQFGIELDYITQLGEAYKNAIVDAPEELADNEEYEYIDSIKGMIGLKRNLLKYNLSERIKFYKKFSPENIKFLIRRALKAG